MKDLNGMMACINCGELFYIENVEEGDIVFCNECREEVYVELDLIETVETT